MPAERSTSMRRALDKAKSVAAALKAEHQAGLRGDESPPAPVWPTASQQFAAVKRWLVPTKAPEAPAELEADAEELADALRRVDWDGVRTAVSEKTTDVAATMKEMAAHVDWSKVQPVAAQVSSALIAAVAAGRIPVGGRLGPIVARAITDQHNLANRVATDLERSDSAVPSEFRQIIETTAREG